MSTPSKQNRYRNAYRQLEELLRDLEDPVAVMSTAAAVLHEANPSASWTGFYRVVDKELLRVGPYQGPVGCLEISFDRGVCGAAARQLRTQVVSDVDAFPGHIACDPRSKSEIVVPVLDRHASLVAVLDVDSHEPAAFDAIDGQELERIAELLASRL